MMRAKHKFFLFNDGSHIEMQEYEELVSAALEFGNSILSLVKMKVTVDV